MVELVCCGVYDAYVYTGDPRREVRESGGHVEFWVYRGGAGHRSATVRR